MFRLTNHLLYLACGGVILLVAQFACASSFGTAAAGPGSARIESYGRLSFVRCN